MDWIDWLNEQRMTSSTATMLDKFTNGFNMIICIGAALRLFLVVINICNLVTITAAVSNTCNLITW